MQCRKGEGRQIRETHELFRGILAEAGIDAEGLVIKRAESSKQWVWFDDVLLGSYNYSNGIFRAQNGCVYDYKFDTLTKPDGSKEIMRFSEFMDLII
ncbi:MAG: hypothetical protein IKZ08_02935 [Bacteroidales bacterium]|nr:hypothetical protein [Bacteroidales bacterium]